MTTFADFYAQFPRKKSRGDAEKAWKQMIKDGHHPDDIIAGLRRNLADLKSRNPQYVPYPATWLRAQGWADEPDPIAPRNNGRRTIADAAASFNARFDNFDAAFGLPLIARH